MTPERHRCHQRRGRHVLHDRRRQPADLHRQRVLGYGRWRTSHHVLERGCGRQHGERPSRTPSRSIRPSRTRPTACPALTGTNGWYTSAVSIVTLESPATPPAAWRRPTTPSTAAASRPTPAAPSRSRGVEAHQITFWSVDAAGNTEAAGSDNFKIDSDQAERPRTACRARSAANGWYTSASVSVTLTATDATSGVAATYYTIDGGSQQSYTGSAFVRHGRRHPSHHLLERGRGRQYGNHRVGHAQDRQRQAGHHRQPVGHARAATAGTPAPSVNVDTLSERCHQRRGGHLLHDRRRQPADLHRQRLRRHRRWHASPHLLERGRGRQYGDRRVGQLQDRQRAADDHATACRARRDRTAGTTATPSASR